MIPSKNFWVKGNAKVLQFTDDGKGDILMYVEVA